MPFIRIQLKEGRPAELKQKVAEEIIDVLDRNGMAKPESVRVIYEDMAPEDFYTGKKKD